jgi:alkanesulfonate monooxygenase SsuD/methylene tetrahydromethanopterin reductase-like flavin-dependent oxidoreductase (luciferase family)
MRLGASLLTRYPAGDPRYAARCIIEHCRAVRDAGADMLLIGDRHAVGPGQYFQNAPMLGRLLAEWGTNPSGVLITLSLWPPVLAAEQISTLASIAAGPCIVVSAIGQDAEQFEAFGLNIHDRVALFESAFDAFRRLLAGDEVTVDNGVHRIVGARISPIPPDGVEHWIGADASKAIDRAARLAEGWMARYELNPDQAAERARYYLERCEKYARTPRAVAIRRNIYIGATDRDAEKVASSYFNSHPRIEPAACVWGGVSRVTDLLAAYAGMGYTDIVVRELVEDHEENMRSFERLGQVRDALRSL